MMPFPAAAAHADTRPPAIRRLLILMCAVLLAGAFIFSALGSSGASAAIAAPAAAQCNGIDNTPGLAIDCSITVNNFLDLATGLGTATVTATVCRGAANTALTCATDVSRHTTLISSVTQCNDAVNGGGGVGNCSVDIVNTITGTSTPIAATVNQCVGSGTGDPAGAPTSLACSPVQETTNATVTQCNGSVTGGGAPGRVMCSVATNSTHTTAVPVSINQCNGSVNGGGSFLTCTASITNRILPAVVVPPVPTPSDNPTDTPSTPPTTPTTPTSPTTPTTPTTPTDTPSTPPSTPPGDTPSAAPSATPNVPESSTPGSPSSATPTPGVTPGGNDGGGNGNGNGSGNGGGTGGTGGGDTLASTGPESVVPLTVAAVLLLLFGGLALLPQRARHSRTATSEDNRDNH